MVPTPKQIENTIDALRRLAEAIENLQKKRADTKAALISSLAKDFATGPLNVERAIAKHKSATALDGLLASKIESAEQLRSIVKELIEDLKRSHPDTLKAALHRKLEQLEKEATGEEEEALRLKEQIDCLKALLQQIDKAPAEAKGKRA